MMGCLGWGLIALLIWLVTALVTVLFLRGTKDDHDDDDPGA